MTEQNTAFQCRDIHVSIEDKQVVRGVDLQIGRGEIHALMGPNGSGKSTLANSLMGHPAYTMTQGQITVNGVDLTEASPDERSRGGMFLAFQYPVAVPGVTVANFLRAALKARVTDEAELKTFRKRLKAEMDLLGIDHSFAARYVNDGFSGGEKKRLEILQMALLKPSIALLDETDSGLDIDALRTVAEGVNALRGPDRAIVTVTHYQRLLNYIVPDQVHVLAGGRIVKSGDKALALRLEEEGYGWITEANAA